jgi:hypothetical protein
MAPSKKIDIRVRVLQNGHPVADCIKSVGRGLKIELTPNYEGDLALPLYPMPENITIFRRKGGQLSLSLDQAWSGFFTSSGILRTVDEHDREERLIPVAVGDYGSLCWRDLRVLFRVVKHKSDRVKEPPRAKGYSAGFLALALGTSMERRSLAIGVVCSALLTGLAIFGLLRVDKIRPSSLEDLTSDYTLPFISPEHLRLVPEALKLRLDRINYVRPTIQFYRTLSEVLTGRFGDDAGKFLKETTIDRYRRLHKDFEEQGEIAMRQQEAINEKVLSDPRNGMVFVPSVVGENVEQRMYRAFDKAHVLDLALAASLRERRRISHKFASDESYDWMNYHSQGPGNTKAKDYLSRIRVFSELNNEQRMYADAEALANQASQLQTRKFGSENPGHDGSGVNLAYIAIDKDVDFSSFIDKFSQIRASSFDIKRKEVIKEPLIGELDPSLIQKTLSKNQFQLQLCYELALRRNIDARGSMDWQWRIDSRGRISDIILKGTSIADRRMVECVRNKMAQWTFPHPRRGSIEVNHSFQFSPRKG